MSRSILLALTAAVAAVAVLAPPTAAQDAKPINLSLFDLSLIHI